MDGFKPLLDVGGKPALVRLLDTIALAGIENIIVITGHGYEKIEAIIGVPTVKIIYNKDYESGMFGSVKTGIKDIMGTDSARPETAALLFPVDVPLVNAHTITGLISAFERNQTGTGSVRPPNKCFPKRRPFAVPVFEGRNGHPLLIPGDYFEEILAYEGEGGLKGVRSIYDADMIRYDVNDEGCVLDMDTREDYAKLLEYDERQRQEE
jgi:CTP:molybdopterin cytidylyltransferase MocA